MIAMQALSCYNHNERSLVEPALNALEDRRRGLTADSCFTAGRVFARFVWPDEPPELAAELHSLIADFRSRHSRLCAVLEGSPEWNAVFHGWRSDPESASAIAIAFRKQFGDRLCWVESERDTRGRIAATCKVEWSEGLQIVRPVAPALQIAGKPWVTDAFGEIEFHLSWKDSYAQPVGRVPDADSERFQLSVNEVFQWAGKRIRTVLDQLHERLQQLYRDRFRGLYVFGSYARPDAGVELPEGSDLDVALLLTEFESSFKEIEKFGDITSALSLEHGLLVSVVPMREADFTNGNTNFARVIGEYAVPVK
jgi:predicted nucleotidyltransferase